MSTFVVTTRADVVDAGDEVLSLREALAQAEAHAGADTITFDTSVFTPDNGTIVLRQGTLEITQAGGPLTIRGDLNGDHVPDVTIDAHHESGTGVLHLVGASDTQRADVTLAGLKITGAGYYGGIDAADVDLRIDACIVSGNQGQFRGGGVSIIGGSALVSDTTISENSARSVGGGIRAEGADLTVIRSSIFDNTSGVRYAGKGGGIFAIDGSCTIIETTLSGNSAYNYLAASGADVPGVGGAIAAIASALSLTNSTVVANRVTSGAGYYTPEPRTGRGGGIYVRDAEARLANTIVAGNIVSEYAPDAPSDVFGTIVSNGHNLFSEGGITGAAASDLLVPFDEVFTNVLAPLADNGATTRTFAPLPGSPAIDAGANADAIDAAGDPLTVDQRGLLRIRHEVVDIGAVEAGPAAIVDGTDDSDRIAGGPFATWIRGIGGADTLTGGDGADTLYGGDGSDLVQGWNGRDYILAGQGDDTCGGGRGNDLILGGDGDDLINGGGGNDILRGDAGDDRLGGGYGYDSLEGGDGADSLIGGDGGDTVDGGAGADRVWLGAGSDSVTGEGADTIAGGDGNDTVGGSFSGYVQLGDGNDYADVGHASVFGGDGNDTLTGYAAALSGEAGNDSIEASFDSSRLSGGVGEDTIAGSGMLDGGTGDDTLLVARGTAEGGLGNDHIMVTSRGSLATLRGGEGDDTLVGGTGRDDMDGGAGNDSLTGTAQNDTLAGGDGADTLLGGRDVDILTGGSGGDQFIFGAGSSSTSAPDTLTDFETGIDALVIVTGVDHGTFLGAGAFTGGGGIEVRWNAGAGRMEVDLNGDGALGTTDLAIAGASLASLTADDLVFL